MQRKSQLGRTHYYAMNPLTQVLIQSLSFYTKSKGKKFSMSTLEIFSSPLYLRVIFFRTVDLCRLARNYTPCLGLKGKKPYPVQLHITVQAI